MFIHYFGTVLLWACALNLFHEPCMFGLGYDMVGLRSCALLSYYCNCCARYITLGEKANNCLQVL